MVVLFWLDLWEIFFLATPGFEPGTSGSLVCTLPLHHSATSGFHLWQFQVLKSGAEGLVVVLFWLDLWEIFFLATPGFEPGNLWISSPALSPPQWLLVFTFDNFSSGAEGLVGVLFWLDHRGFLFGHTSLTSGFHLLLCHNLRYQLTIWCRGIGGGIVLIGPVRDFLFGHTRVWTRDLWISSPALYHCAMVTTGFHSLTISGIELWCRGIGGGIVLIGPVRDFLFGHTRVWTGDLWISSPALYHCTMVTSGFHL